MKGFNLFKHNNTENLNDGFTVDETVFSDMPEIYTPKKTRLMQEVFDWLDVIVISIIAVVVLFSFVFRIATIDGDSMRNTLIGTNEMRGTIGDKVIITNFAYTPKQGDIVVVSRNIENTAQSQSTNKGPIIKRVIAVGGQTVNIDFDTATVYVDGVALDEPYISTPTDRQFDVVFPLYIPEGSIFVMGDNRQNSLDSRSSAIGDGGLIDTRYVLGHAVFRIFPFDRIGRLDNK